jgi:hypothetical protein
MSTYATRHHPQVQARRIGQFLNSWRREHYVAVLEDAGEKGSRSLSRTELFKMVRERGLGPEVERRFTWQNKV